jgi:hypothetical protein
MSTSNDRKLNLDQILKRRKLEERMINRIDPQGLEEENREDLSSKANGLRQEEEDLMITNEAAIKSEETEQVRPFGSDSETELVYNLYNNNNEVLNTNVNNCLANYNKLINENDRRRR